VLLVRATACALHVVVFCVEMLLWGGVKAEIWWFGIKEFEQNISATSAICTM
jgi:hypothetical protein